MWASTSLPAARRAPLHGIPWPDTGSTDAGNCVRVLESLQVGCPEELAWRMGFLDDALRSRAELLVTSGYGRYLLDPLS